jgi:polar amino acid transport system substrate-binding protein
MLIRQIRWSVLATAVLLVAGPAQAQADADSAQAARRPGRLTITTEAVPPSSMLDAEGRVVGFSTDKVRAALDRAGIAYTIELLPWKRAYAAARDRGDACVYATTRTPERESLFKWVGPIDSAEWVLMARANHRFSLRTLDDARPYRIGTYNGDARDEFLRSRGFRVDSAPNDITNPRKLLLGRIDLWAAALRVGSRVLEQNGWAGKIVPVLVFIRIDVYLACNRTVPDESIARLNAVFSALERDGTMRRIERGYDNWSVEQQGK